MKSIWCLFIQDISSEGSEDLVLLSFWVEKPSITKLRVILDNYILSSYSEEVYNSKLENLLNNKVIMINDFRYKLREEFENSLIKNRF